METWKNYTLDSRCRCEQGQQAWQSLALDGIASLGYAVLDKENNPVLYLSSAQSIMDINYVVDDSSPHPLFAIALSCPDSVDGHPINYAPLRS
jgi:hypothetical protein